VIWADGGYNARQVDAAVAKVPRLRLEIVKRSEKASSSCRAPEWFSSSLLVRAQPAVRQGF
jgi:hypothetical protein